MRLTAFSVRHWQFTVVLFAMMGALGLAAWSVIPRLEDPPIDFPEFTVVSILPGASPTDLERLVVTEVEKRLDELDDVKSIASRVRDGVATTRVAFQPEEDPDKKYDEVIREMNALRPSLPAELVRFDVEKSSTLDVNILQLALVAPHTDYRTLDSLAEHLTDRLRAVTGVRTAGVLLYGLARPSQQPEAGRLASVPDEWMDALAAEIRGYGLTASVSP